MKATDINDPLFLQAVNALDEGRLDNLSELVKRHPGLIRDCLKTPGQEGYFKDPYLIWFVADNPIRNPKLPANILDILKFLIDAVKREAPDTCHQQLDYTLCLVVTGWVPRECGVQLTMMNVLIEAGSALPSVMDAVTNGNIDAANHLIEQGGKLTLASAIVLNREEDIDKLFDEADNAEKLTALTAAAFYGKADKVTYLLNKGVGPNGYPGKESRFHSHAAPLHQAVSSGSLEVVKLLVNSGARLDMPDKMYSGTPLDWAMYLQNETGSETERAAYARIEAYLKEVISKSE